MLQSGWALICLLLFRAGTGGEVMPQCLVSPAGALHPVQAQFERFEAGPGCAAREGGAKETHVISVSKPSQSTDKKVTVVLKPLSYSHPVHRPVILVLSSQHAVHWLLESEELPQNLHVLVQVSVNSTLENGSVSARVHSIPSLPWRPRALLRWTLQRHETISSLTHSASANHVCIRLGEDPSMPSVCRLQSLFLSHNYMASTLKEQEVNGCISSESLSNQEVHVIKLWSAGSGLCGSLQVEVSVSLLPPVADAGWCNVVLVLSSAAPVNWALVTPGLRGHITVHSSHSMTPLYPPKPDLTINSAVVPDLLTTPDLLDWADRNDYPSVTSYTEAHLANRIVIKLKGGGAVQTLRAAKVEETWLRRWMSGKVDEAAGSRKVISVQCVDGRLAVSVDKNVLQALTLSVSAVTLKDPSCQAWSNGTHFLLAFPVISCGTEGEMEKHSREVQYTNMILLWRSKPSDVPETSSETPADESTPLVIHVRCSAPLPASTSSSSRPQGMLRSRNGVDPAPSKIPQPAPGPAPALILVPHGAPLLSMQLFATDRFEQRAVGPCVVTVQGRVYTEISGSVGVSKSFAVRSCVLSPLSDPRAPTSWPIVRDFCPVDSSFLAHTKLPSGDDGDESTKEIEDEKDEGETRMTLGATVQDTDTVHIRFSFILRPVFNNSIQFLHCSLQLCDNAMETHGDCTHTPTTGQCEYRNLSRPVLVTYLPDALAGLVPPPAGKLSQKPRVTETVMSRHSSSSAVASSVVISVIGAFLMGISLMGVLWCIYSCTGGPEAARKNTLQEIPSSQSPTEQATSPV